MRYRPLEERYRLTISNLRAPRSVQLYDPMTDKAQAIRARTEREGVTVEVSVMDYPRLLVVEER